MADLEVGPERADALRGEGATIVDVRTGPEVREERIAGALAIPLDELAARQGELPQAGALVFVCRSGERSLMAAQALAGTGREAVSVAGGLDAWSAAGLPVEKG